MNFKNHPFFFPLLKKLIIITLKRVNDNVLSGNDKEEIERITGVKKGYCAKIFVNGVYSTRATQNRVGKTTLTALLKVLPEEWGYSDWFSFQREVTLELVDKKLLNDLPNKDYEDQQAKYQERIIEEIEGIAKRRLLWLLSQGVGEKPIEDIISDDTDIENGEIVSIVTKTSRYLPKRYASVLLLFLIVLIAINTLVNNSKDNNSDLTSSETLSIESTVKESVELEMKAYQHIDQSFYGGYLDSLESVYDEKPLKKVEKILKGCSKRNWALSNDGNPSNSQCLHVHVDSIIENIAYVSTLESWLINWFNTETKQYEYRYDVINRQRYWLQKKDNNNWIIVDNVYSGNAPKSLPKNYTYDDLIAYIEVVPNKFKHNVLEALATNNLEQAIAMLRFYIEHNNTHFKNDEIYLAIISLSSEFYEAQVALNNTKSTAKTFEEVEKEVLQKTYRILEEVSNIIQEI